MSSSSFAPRMVGLRFFLLAAGCVGGSRELRDVKHVG
jgi:hypothetical protein